MVNTTVPPEEGTGEGSLELFVAAAILSFIGVTVSLALLGFSIKTQNLRIIKMSSPKLNMLTCLGCFVSYITCLVWSLPHLNTLRHTSSHDVMCKVKPWLMTYAFTIIIGPCVTKSWRVQQIFKNVPKKKIVIKDRLLLVIVTVLLLIDTLILALWTGLDIPSLAYQTKQVSVRVPGGESPPPTSYTNPICFSNYLPVWITVLCVYKLVLLAYGAYVSWTIRSISIPSMNDSGSITLAITGTAVLGSATVALVTVTEPWAYASDVVVVLGLWFCTTLVLALVFIPKIMLLRSYTAEGLLATPFGAQVIHSPSSPLQKVEEDCYQLTAENRRLKHIIKQKENELDKTLEKLAAPRTQKDTMSPKFRPDDQLRDSGIVCEEKKSQRIKAVGSVTQTQHTVPVYQTLSEETHPKTIPIKQEYHWYDTDSSTTHGQAKHTQITPNPGGSLHKPHKPPIPSSVGPSGHRPQHIPQPAAGPNLHNHHSLPRPNGLPGHQQQQLPLIKVEQIGRLHPPPLSPSGTDVYEKLHYVSNHPAVAQLEPPGLTPVDGTAIPVSSTPDRVYPVTQGNVKLYEAISSCPLHGKLMNGYHSPEESPIYDYYSQDRLSTLELASAISESYDLDKDDEALSYISTCISTIPSTRPKRRKKTEKSRKSVKKKYGNKKGATLAISNDQYYPSGKVQDKREKDKEDTAEQGNAHSQELRNKKVYYIDVKRNPDSYSFV